VRRLSIRPLPRILSRLLLFLPLLLNLFWGDPLRAETRSFTDSITGAELLELIEKGEAPLILDVRTAREYKRGRIPGAINLHYREDFSLALKLLGDRQKPLIIYCAYGPRAAWARRKLESLGFTNVITLTGHMAKWERERRPLER